ncbi:YggS family pyridoxal phosphate-dependent enzyme [Cellulomonas sp. ATA003]|uniref:YggS family pyridoxal phosphate-dependent enzyme n=1 Tax=Cellulomonas sp. ATA003 TaxID=3073064 RepID=UPI002873A398|nr:YggS family pyridoxal phosphate-dependent enzyme [Cellulomonas sp. ATA003]WNB84686.1 YggS family pyridoxal phosphate-dependent enzyme [Cellulomonas sp. ATA003]
MATTGRGTAEGDGGDATGVRERLVAVHERLLTAEDDAGRPAGSVRLLLATKTVDVAGVRAALAVAPGLGGRRVVVGENRVQELVAKAPDLSDVTDELHLIGHLQSNKVNAALRWATCVQSVDTLDLARRLDLRAAAAGRRLDVLVQVNVSGEDSKYGVAPDDAVELALAVAALEGLRLRGLMTIGARSPDDAVVRAGFARLRELRDAVLASGAPGTADATELSMGMSGDLEVAVAEGSTTVRVGTAVFGGRPPLLTLPAARHPVECDVLHPSWRANGGERRTRHVGRQGRLTGPAWFGTLVPGRGVKAP